MSVRVFLSGLPFSVQDQDLAQRFSLPTEAVHVARDRRRDRSLGYGFMNLPPDAARLLLDQGVFAWGSRTVSVRGAHAERAETIWAAHESGPTDLETLRTGKFEGCAIYALNNADLREARNHLGIFDPARQRVIAELLRRRRSATRKRLATGGPGARRTAFR
jgi:hypothetical protein